MIWASGPLLPLVALIWPLLLGVLASLPAIRPHALRLLPLAPLPALWLALTGVEGLTLAPNLLLGVMLAAGRPAALLLGMTAALWFAAALHAQGSMAGTRKPAVFSGFWCLTLAGNLGVFLAQDVVTFYVAFAAVSLSAYFLVVHEGTPAALRAGRVYAALAIVGEVCLLAAFVIGAASANGLLISDIRAALLSAPLGGVATVLLIAGFGIKAGLMPLHLWLPLAHPAAPTPASAVLSGAIVKAGIIGMMMFVPLATMAGSVLLVIGLGTAFVAALTGLRVRAPKAILAYSTISQMGLVIALVGAATQADGSDMAPAAFYAFHHGLAKGALFLSVALVALSTGRWRNAALVLVVLVALSVAGGPLTGGGLAKAMAKSGLGSLAEFALTISAATTTLLLGWFVHRLSASAGKAKASGGGRPTMLVVLPTVGLALAALVMPWWLWSEWSTLAPDYPLRLAAVWSALWPVVLGMGLIGVMAANRWPVGTLDEADPLPVARWLARQLSPLRAVPKHLARTRSLAADQIVATVHKGSRWLAQETGAMEGGFLRGQISGLAFLTFILLVAAVSVP
ncbi:complex I subunit 5 family protein [Altererythrobacter sp. KTW20L]|uniref:complex I subunit 5 family protein n=1 Tax=Altererythrobacter sp. KTW20L TaxID=2942210 RepID=UPI0020C158A8|nr:complex I subunit 5 family protein [Altererythrobacter sp. KTW20L]MCL6251950.1 complex I subunit 5 family protein [Altererythrobacter sp. KTW20L]